MLKELPKKKQKIRYEGQGSTIMLGGEVENLVTVECPACKGDMMTQLNRVFDCWKCGARIKVPAMVKVK